MFVQKKKKKKKGCLQRVTVTDTPLPRLCGGREGRAAPPCPLTLSWRWDLRRSKMVLAMERACGGAGSLWRGSAGFRVLPRGRGEARGDTGASRLRALNLLFRKRPRDLLEPLTHLMLCNTKLPPAPGHCNG